MKLNYIQISPTLGEIIWQEEISDYLLQSQLLVQQELKAHWETKILECRLGFTRLSISWKMKTTPPAQEVNEWLKKLDLLKNIKPLPEKTWQVPVCYDSDLAKDLVDFTLSKRMTLNQVIGMHSSIAYRIHFFGFLPGFMYLSGLPALLHNPRKSIPDRSVPAGSVAIGGSQTGIYPVESPGGWHLIGRSPSLLFDVKSSPPVWANPGECIKFVPISKQEYDALIRFPKIPIFK
jgi:KipI family sensor histidine kinase inhibitor